MSTDENFTIKEILQKVEAKIDRVQDSVNQINSRLATVRILMANGTYKI